MPLVLHESSSCDVCLDSYAWTTPDDAPHAIPCGHIFCRSCLLSVEPTNCPLCRKAFNRERIKKLHVEPPESDAERDLMRRLALAFDAETREQARISDDLNAWLESRHEDDHPALRKAWAAFKEYNKMTEHIQQDRHTIRRFERQVKQLFDDAQIQTDASNAIESNLRTEIAEINGKLRDLRAEVEPLREELARYQHRANPLPAPPEPVPLDRFPLFARAAAESKDGLYPYLTPGGTSYTNLLATESQPPATDKGKGKQPPPVDLVYINPTENFIIPGASPSQRIVPAVPRAERKSKSKHTYRTHAPASAYVNGYATGYGEGYNAANNGLASDDPYNYASTSAHQLPPRQEEQESSLETAIGGLRLWNSGLGEAALAQVVVPPDSGASTVAVRDWHSQVAPPSNDATSDNASILSRTGTASSIRPSALRRSTVQVDGHLSNGVSSSSRQPPPPLYANAPPVSHDTAVRFDAGPEAQNLHTTQEATVRRANHERNRLNRRSYSSWGTVHTAADSTGTRGSMSDLGGLTNFPLLATIPAQPASVSSHQLSERSMTATPRQDHAPRTLLGFTGAPASTAASRNQPTHNQPGADNGNAPVSYDPNSYHPYSYDTNMYDPNIYDPNSRRRSAPRRVPQPSTDSSGRNTVDPQSMDNALGLDLGVEAASTAPLITAPTPRVQMGHFLRSWSQDYAVR
ncbi:RING-type domain-containing protein [Favolaschia claudopus]|uniref:RING-type domain-containing protein n=1 Tax=Favolaschia claudopus TaxID=2862362 RepID=A0AAW0EJU8_9AGAR